MKKQENSINDAHILDTDKKNGEYIFYKNNEQWVHLIDGTEFKTAKMVYSTFKDKTLSPFDPFWDIKYLDNNPDNLYVDNLILK